MHRPRALPLTTRSGALAAEHATCDPVWQDAHVVDLEVRELSRAYAERLHDEPHYVDHGDPTGRRLSDLFPASRGDGTLAAFCHVAETGEPFTYTRPAPLDASRPPRRVHVTRQGDHVLVESRALDDDQVLEELRQRDGPRWRQAFALAPLGVAVASYAGVLMEVNDAACRAFGRTREQLVGYAINDFSHPDDRHLRIDRTALHREGRHELRKRYVTGDGRVVWLRLVATLVVESGELRALSFIEDVTDAVRSREALTRLAREDGLTGLPNRLAFRDRLRAALTADRLPSLLYLDLDHFKVVNDSLGHDTGDQVLREVARAVTAAVRERGVVGRLGGDELVVLVHDGAQGRQVAEEVLLAVSGSRPVAGLDLPVGLSIGVAHARPDSDDDTLLRDADTALYAAKREGRGRLVVFDAALRARAHARLADEVALRQAVANDEVVVHYQPLWDRRGRLRAVEALVRWQHPTRGLLLPGSFLDVAEETGLVLDLDRAVLRRSASDLAAWRTRAPRLRLSVNVAPAHLMSGTLLRDVAEALGPHGLDAGALALEITESALVSGPGITGTLQGLRAQGCRVALDDFGTGFSSLAYLRDFPVDVVKVDRSFVTGATQPRGATLLTGICGLGRSLGLDVVVEGIETAGEQEAARAAGTDLLQGYLLGRPVPAGEIDALLDRALHASG